MGRGVGEKEKGKEEGNEYIIIISMLVFCSIFQAAHDVDKTDLEIGSEDHPSVPRQPKHRGTSFHEDLARSRGNFQPASDQLGRANRPVGTGSDRSGILVSKLAEGTPFLK